MSRGAMDSAAVPDASAQRPRHVFRSDTRWGRSVMEWGSIEAFLGAAEVESGVHSIPIGEFAGKRVNYDFLVTARPGTTLLCHSYGVMPQDGNVGECIGSTFSRQGCRPKVCRDNHENS